MEHPGPKPEFPFWSPRATRSAALDGFCHTADAKIVPSKRERPGALQRRAGPLHIFSLRQKLEEDPKAPSLILTVPGLRYKLAPFVYR